MENGDIMGRRVVLGCTDIWMDGTVEKTEFFHLVLLLTYNIAIYVFLLTYSMASFRLASIYITFLLSLTTELHLE